MAVRDISLERRGGFIFAALDLNRDNLRSVLQYKINLAVLVRVISRLNLKLTAELLQEVVFR